jgi:hypothetical protein
MGGIQIPLSSNMVTYQGLGHNAVELTNWSASAAGVIAAGSNVEVAGALFNFSSDDTNDTSSFSAITTGATAYLQLVATGTVGSQIVTSSWTSTVPSYRADFHGWYASAASADRVVAGCVKTGTTSYEYKFIMEDRGTLNTSVPIGFTYVQYPNQIPPAYLWPWATWTNVSSSYAGDFFRTEGGDASAFESGEQAHQVQDHGHSKTESAHTHTTGENISSTSGGATPAIIRGTANLPGTFTLSSTTTGSVIGNPNSGNHGTETRPVNRTIRVWKRTA